MIFVCYFERELYILEIVEGCYTKNIINGILFSTFRESQLISTNAILTLGYIGVHLRYTQNRRTVESVLQIFQQRFCSPPSALDAMIVDQLADIVIAGCVSKYTCI